MPSVPSIVMLHYVSDDHRLDPHQPWVISHESFIRLLDHLQHNDYTTLTFKDVVNKTDRYSKSGKKIIITFDDCPKHLWDFAIPELQKRKMTASFYMPTAELNGTNSWNIKDGLPKIELMGEQDMKHLVEIGMEVGSHACHHDFLELKNPDEVMHELRESKAVLEKATGDTIVSIAYPYGSIPHNYREVVKAAGYDYGLAVYAFWNHRYTLRRWIYDDGFDEAKIKEVLSAGYDNSRAIQDKRRYFKTHILPWTYNKYTSIKKKLKRRSEQ